MRTCKWWHVRIFCVSPLWGLFDGGAFDLYTFRTSGAEDCGARRPRTTMDGMVALIAVRNRSNNEDQMGEGSDGFVLGWLGLHYF